MGSVVSYVSYFSDSLAIGLSELKSCNGSVVTPKLMLTSGLLYSTIVVEDATGKVWLTDDEIGVGSSSKSSVGCTLRLIEGSILSSTSDGIVGASTVGTTVISNIFPVGATLNSGLKYGTVGTDGLGGLSNIEASGLFDSNSAVGCIKSPALGSPVTLPSGITVEVANGEDVGELEADADLVGEAVSENINDGEKIWD